MNAAKILVVEDEETIADHVQLTLERLGYTVAGRAALGEEALERTAESHPDLVLMDISLKGEIDGVEAAARIWARFQTPVVFLTGHSDMATFQRAQETGLYGYVVKPLVERDLYMAIEMALGKHRSDRQLIEREHWFSLALESLGEAVIATGPEGLIRFINPLAEFLTGWKRFEAVGRPLESVLVLPSRDGDADVGGKPVPQALSKGLVVDWSGKTRMRPLHGPEILIDFTSACIRLENGQVAGVVVVFRDATQRQQAEEDRERLIRELQHAIEALHTLRGLLPICASCKKIRTDEGYWEQLESYISKHTLAKFSHSMCPDCVELYYGDLHHKFPLSLAEG